MIQSILLATSEQDRCVESHKKSSVIIERKKALGKAHHVGCLNVFLTRMSIVKLYVQSHRCASTIVYLALG